MSKFRKLMAAAAILFGASAMLVGCSDDDNKTMGPIGINSVQSTSTTVTLYWTIVTNGSLEGYNVQIVEGTRANKGAVVVSQDFESRTAKNTFTGLKPNTTYVAITKGIPASGSGFTESETYELQFMTAPLVQNITTGTPTFTEVTSEDEEGNEVTDTVGTVTANWAAISENAGTLTVALYRFGLADLTKPAGDDNKEGWNAVTSANVALATTSRTFKDLLMPETKYRVGVRPNPSNGDWYASGEWQYSPEFTTPAYTGSAAE